MLQIYYRAFLQGLLENRVQVLGNFLIFFLLAARIIIHASKHLDAFFMRSGEEN